MYFIQHFLCYAFSLYINIILVHFICNYMFIVSIRLCKYTLDTMILRSSIFSIFIIRCKSMQVMHLQGYIFFFILSI